MKRISITVDEETLNLLDGKVNKSELIRQSLKIYNGDISTDTLAAMRESFRRMERNQIKNKEEVETQIIYLTEIIEKLNNKIGDASGGY